MGVGEWGKKLGRGIRKRGYFQNLNKGDDLMKTKERRKERKERKKERKNEKEREKESKTLLASRRNVSSTLTFIPFSYL